MCGGHNANRNTLALYNMPQPTTTVWSPNRRITSTWRQDKAPQIGIITGHKYICSKNFKYIGVRRKRLNKNFKNKLKIQRHFQFWNYNKYALRNLLQETAKALYFAVSYLIPQATQQRLKTLFRRKNSGIEKIFLGWFQMSLLHSMCSGSLDPENDYRSRSLFLAGQ